jgi:hypothetical protein
VTPDALAQIREAQDWWQYHRSDAPIAVEEALEAAFVSLLEYPNAGRIAVDVRQAGIRRLPLPPFITGSTIESSAM